MNLVSIRIITQDIDGLINFYEKISGVSGVKYTVDFAELKTKQLLWPSGPLIHCSFLKV